MDVLSGFFWLVSAALYSAVWLVRFVLTLPLRLVRVGRNRRKAHGSARWAHRWEQWWHGAVRGEGVILGRGALRRLLRFSSDGMVMVFAAMGAGKGLGFAAFFDNVQAVPQPLDGRAGDVHQAFQPIVNLSANGPQHR